jgi:uncharacterized protein (TIGR03435 family)
MNTMRGRIYETIIGLHPAEFRNRFGREMILDFDDACATHRPASLYLDALQSIVLQWASQLFPSAIGPQSAQASLLSGQYVSLSQPNPSAFELIRASCIAMLLFFSIGFSAATRPSVAQIANAGSHATSAPSARRSVQSSAHKFRYAVASRATIAAFGPPAKSQGAERGPAIAYGVDLSPAVAYVVLLCLYLTLRSYLRKPRVLRSVLVTAIILALTAPVHAQTKQAVLSFDVVSVKPSDPAKEHLALYWRRPDGLKWDGVTLSGMVANAYGVSPIVKGQIEGGPAWMGSRAFDINAKVDAETAARWSKMTQAAVDEERRSMMTSLLADRFHLTFHHETREMLALVLRVAKSGSKLQSPQPEHDLQAGTPLSRINFFGHGHWEGHSALMSTLARSLASEPEIAGRPVVDKTGLTSGYDFTLRWTPDGPAPPDPNAQWPSLFTAINEQLGIKLTPEKQPIDIIVVDSVEMPGEN